MTATARARRAPPPPPPPPPPSTPVDVIAALAAPRIPRASGVFHELRQLHVCVAYAGSWPVIRAFSDDPDGQEFAAAALEVAREVFGDARTVLTTREVEGITYDATPGVSGLAEYWASERPKKGTAREEQARRKAVLSKMRAKVREECEDLLAHFRARESKGLDPFGAGAL